MVKTTFDRESCFQCTNTTKVPASKPTQKMAYWDFFFFFYCSECLVKYWEFAFRGHIHKTKNKNDNLTHGILLTMLSVIFQKQNGSNCFLSEKFINHQYNLFSVTFTLEFQKSHNFLLSSLKVTFERVGIYFQDII